MEDRRKTIKTDLSGLRIGFLTIENPTNKVSSSGRVWESVCDCGNVVKIPNGTIRRAIREGYQISCGKCEFAIVKNNVSKEEAAFNNLYSLYKGHAKLRGLSFELTRDQFKNLTSSNCHYCGTKPYQMKHNYSKAGKYMYNGIDRLNPEFGYILENCVPACGACNLMKQSMTEMEFYNHIKKIVEHSQFSLVTEKNIYRKGK